MFIVTRPPEERDSITITFVSPLVLRKELENMLDNDGDIALQSAEVVEKKSVIFWNMVSIVVTVILRVPTVYENPRKSSKISWGPWKSLSWLAGFTIRKFIVKTWEYFVTDEAIIWELPILFAARGL